MAAAVLATSAAGQPHAGAGSRFSMVGPASVSSSTKPSLSVSTASEILEPVKRNSGTMPLSSAGSTKTSTPRPAHSKLHKRKNSAPPSTTSPLAKTYSSSDADSESFPPLHPIASTRSNGSASLIKPYLRKKASTISDQDQGRLDLATPTFQNDALNELRKDDLFASHSSPDVGFGPTYHRPHSRAMSTDSRTSVGSQPFVHPMRQTPRPFVPLTPSSLSFGDASDDDEQHGRDSLAHERFDSFETDFTIGRLSSRGRSQSFSTGPTAASNTSMSLTHAHTTSDLSHYTPSAVRLASSNTNNSSRTSLDTTGPSRRGRSRHGPSHSTNDAWSSTAPSTHALTSRSHHPAPLPQGSRSSLDHAFSFVSRCSDPSPPSDSALRAPSPPASRDKRIHAARRAFDDKQAHKDRKRALQRGSRSARDGHDRRDGSIDEARAALRGRAYDETAPASAPLAFPAAVDGNGEERLDHESFVDESDCGRPRRDSPQTGVVRFSAWFQTRMLAVRAGKGTK